MLVTMLVSRYGSPDAFVVDRYHKGKVYDMQDSLACRFIREKTAREATYMEKYHKKTLYHYYEQGEYGNG